MILVSQSRPRLGCFCGTFSPSRRQIRSTRLKFTDPARSMQHHRDAAIAVTAVLDGERDDVGGQCRFIIRGRRDLALRRAMLAQNTAGKSFWDAKFSNNMIYASTATRGA